MLVGDRWVFGFLDNPCQCGRGTLVDREGRQFLFFSLTFRINAGQEQTQQ